MIIAPAAHTLVNMGEDVSALFFEHNGTVHVVNRAGKRNIKVFFSDVKGTVTITNGVTAYRRMSRSGVRYVAVLDTAGNIIA